MNKEIKHLLQKLVSFASFSSDGNQDLRQFISQYCAPFAEEIYTIPQKDEEKASLLIQVGKAHDTTGLILSGHLDVVPVAQQPWESDPFQLTTRAGHYFGRGVADMKGFIACALALLPTIKSLRAPLYLALTCDEEIGCLAAPAMSEALRRHAPREAFVWVGEPTDLQTVVAQKGIINLRTTVHGRAAHSSQIGQGISAVHIAAELIVAAEKLMFDLQTRYHDANFDVPFTSIHVGQVAGGTAVNVVASECHFDWEIRYLPSNSAAEILALFEQISAAIARRHAGVNIVTSATIPPVPALKATGQNDFLALMDKHNPNPERGYVAYATEAGIYQNAGFATLICGPGNIRVAHQANESIAIRQLEHCAQRLRAVIGEHCGAEYFPFNETKDNP